MMGAALPLDAFPLVHTTSVEEMRASLELIYVKPVMELVGRDRTLHGVMNHCQLQHIGLGFGSYGVGVRYEFPGVDLVTQIFPTGGKGEVRIGGASVTIEPGCGALISANAPFSMVNNPDYRRLLLTIRPAALATKLAAMTGDPIRAPLTMSPVQNFSQPAARIFRDQFMFFVRQLSTIALPPPLILAEIEQMIMTMFLYANRHNYSHLLEQDPLDVAPAQVRRAEDYIEANWNKPMSLEAIAAATEVSSRSLFRSFRQSRGYSPLEFLTQVRLRHARELLQRPDGPATITEIAFTCGFGDPERFSRDYCRAFGERPAQALARGKRPALH